MEGITALIIYGLIAVGLAIAFYFIYKYQKQSEGILSVANPIFDLAVIIAQTFFPESENKKKVVKVLMILQMAVNRVNYMKDEIIAELGSDSTPEERHEAYKEKAIELTEEIAQANNLTVDVMSKKMIEMAIDFILSKMSTKPVAYVDFKEAQTQ
jgi:hypothetical protein